MRREGELFFQPELAGNGQRRFPIGGRLIEILANRSRTQQAVPEGARFGLPIVEPACQLKGSVGQGHPQIGILKRRGDGMDSGPSVGRSQFEGRFVPFGGEAL